MKKTDLFPACCVCSTFSQAVHRTGDFLTQVENGQIIIARYNGTAKDVRIPERR
jgi:hypothetical protein